MFIHGNEVIEPEELAQLGQVFDEAWAAVGATAGRRQGGPTGHPSVYFIAASQSEAVGS